LTYFHLRAGVKAPQCFNGGFAVCFVALSPFFIPVVFIAGLDLLLLRHDRAAVALPELSASSFSPHLLQTF